MSIQARALVCFEVLTMPAEGSDRRVAPKTAPIDLYIVQLGGAIKLIAARRTLRAPSLRRTRDRSGRLASGQPPLNPGWGPGRH